jgi:hypothetical protein
MAFKDESMGVLLFTFGGEVQTMERFDRQVKARFGRSYGAAWKEAVAYVKKFDKDTLLRRRRSTGRSTNPRETNWRKGGRRQANPSAVRVRRREKKLSPGVPGSVPLSEPADERAPSVLGKDGVPYPGEEAELLVVAVEPVAELRGARGEELVVVPDGDLGALLDPYGLHAGCEAIDSALKFGPGVPGLAVNNHRAALPVDGLLE